MSEREREREIDSESESERVSERERAIDRQRERERERERESKIDPIRAICTCERILRLDAIVKSISLISARNNRGHFL